MTFELKACAIEDKYIHPKFPMRTMGAVKVKLSERLDRDYDMDIVIKVWTDSPDGQDPALNDPALIDRALLARAAQILNRTLSHAGIEWIDGAIRRPERPLT